MFKIESMPDKNYATGLQIVKNTKYILAKNGLKYFRKIYRKVLSSFIAGCTKYVLPEHIDINRLSEYIWTVNSV